MNHGPPTRRSALKTIASGAAGYVTASIPLRRASAQSSPKIVLGTLPIPPAIAPYIGEVDFFKDEGLTVEITRFQNFAPIAQGMAAGSVVAGEMGVAPSIIVLTRGLPLIAPFLTAFSTPDHPFERIMVLPDSPIKTLDDLKGKKLAFLGAGTVPDMLLNGLPKRTKITKQDIKLVPTPAPNMPDALAQGLVDAIFAIPPADTVAERKYHARTIANATELVPYAGLSTFALRREFADANPETARKLFRACIRFTRWIDDNPVDARKVVAKNLGLPGDLAAHMRIPCSRAMGSRLCPMSGTSTRCWCRRRQSILTPTRPGYSTKRSSNPPSGSCSPLRKSSDCNPTSRLKTCSRAIIRSSRSRRRVTTRIGSVVC